jgi:hypothetical protein
VTRRRWVPLIALLVSCGQREAPTPAQAAQLAPGIAARVGTEEISVELVSSIARAQAVSPQVARDRAISDALFATLARERFARSGRIESAERGALARALLEELRAEAASQGPPSDGEVDELTRLRWLDLDRPPMARTRHVVIVVKSSDDKAKAKAVAERFAKQLSGIRDPAEFEKRAQSLPSDGLEAKVETLLPVADDGRVAVEGAAPGSPVQKYDSAFSRAANALSEVGDQSPVVESAFGFHIIMLLEKIPASRPSFEERRVLLTREVNQRRASQLQSKLLERLQKTVQVSVERGADSLVSEIQVSR